MAKKATKKAAEAPKVKRVLFIRQPASIGLAYAEGKEYDLPIKQADDLVKRGFCVDPSEAKG